MNEKRIREMEGKESGVLLVVEDDVAMRSLLCDEGRWPEQMRNPIDGSHTEEVLLEKRTLVCVVAAMALLPPQLSQRMVWVAYG